MTIFIMSYIDTTYQVVSSIVNLQLISYQEISKHYVLTTNHEFSMCRNLKNYKGHCVKSVRIRNYSGPHLSRIFPHSDWIRRDTPYFPFSSDKKVKIAFFTISILSFFANIKGVRAHSKLYFLNFRNFYNEKNTFAHFCNCKKWKGIIALSHEIVFYALSAHDHYFVKTYKSAFHTSSFGKL